MGPKFVAQYGNKLGSQLGPMSITKLSPNWACQMGPIHCPKFLLPGPSLYALVSSLHEDESTASITVYVAITTLVIPASIAVKLIVIPASIAVKHASFSSPDTQQ